MILIIILWTIFVRSCTYKTEAESGYIIDAEITGIASGTAYLVNLDLETNEKVYVDSAELKNGKFMFKGVVESPYLHTIYIGEESNAIHLFLENSKIGVSAHMNDLAIAKVTGSREDSLFRSYSIDDIFDRKTGMDIMLNYPHYTYAAFAAYYQFQIYNIQADTMELIMESFDESVRKSGYYKQLEELYNTLRRVAISRPAPDFEIPDVNGTQVRLSDYKGSFVLIDFWASWCSPCRAANPELVKVYKAYKNRAFTVIGISVDTNRGQWLSAIEADGLTWTNLSNTKGWDEVSTLYGVKAIPQNFLLDPNGIIIGKNMEPEVLMEKLDEILPI
ncbi:MAG: TlpA disulfide reductase family protein [Bacteroidota bacterium]